MLVIAHAGAAGLQTCEAAEARLVAVGVKFRREGLADRAFRLQSEQLEESIVAVGQAAVGRPAENCIALRIDKALVPGFALVEPRVHRGSRGQRLLQARARGS